mmetsp:Transcript_22282/g.61901  ORF Transcript_22282/g.61901 Transcript_22282/m.61901 type:complete len:109 (+) Transcript_22282:650-976(+)
MNRNVYKMFHNATEKYCTFDEYNWDWSFVHLMLARLLPHTTLQPVKIPLVQHIVSSIIASYSAAQCFEIHVRDFLSDFLSFFRCRELKVCILVSMLPKKTRGSASWLL